MSQLIENPGNWTAHRMSPWILVRLRSAVAAAAVACWAVGRSGCAAGAGVEKSC